MATVETHAMTATPAALVLPIPASAALRPVALVPPSTIVTPVSTAAVRDGGGAAVVDCGEVRRCGRAEHDGCEHGSEPRVHRLEFGQRRRAVVAPLEVQVDLGLLSRAQRARIAPASSGQTSAQPGVGAPRRCASR